MRNKRAKIVQLRLSHCHAKFSHLIMGGGNGQKSAKVRLRLHESQLCGTSPLSFFRPEKKPKRRWNPLEVCHEVVLPSTLALTSYPAGSQLKSNAAALSKVCAVCKVRIINIIFTIAADAVCTIFILASVHSFIFLSTHACQ